MDWKECCSKKIAKEAKTDNRKITSIKSIAENKFKTALFLTDEHYYGKVTLLYDVLREFLECLALKRGYKIYNHECYTSFLKEIINESNIGDSFDSLRKIRNGINYYGRTVTQEEGLDIINKIDELIKKVKELLEKG